MTENNLQHPSIPRMISALLEAAKAKCWNHLKKDFQEHRIDWVKAGDSRKALTMREYLELPKALADYSYTQLCTYLDYGKIVWGFYAQKLPFGSGSLTQVGVVFDPESDEIIHCMRIMHRKKYFEKKRQFIKIRW